MSNSVVSVSIDRGWIGVAAVTLGTFTLVTNEFIPVGLLTNIAKDMHVAVGVASTTVTVPGHIPPGRDGLLVEHWDVVEDEVSWAESVSGLPMFGERFPDE
jgi:hypothetical protein